MYYENVFHEMRIFAILHNLLTYTLWPQYVIYKLQVVIILIFMYSVK